MSGSATMGNTRIKILLQTDLRRRSGRSNNSVLVTRVRLYMQRRACRGRGARPSYMKESYFYLSSDYVRKSIPYDSPDAARRDTLSGSDR